MRVLVCGGRDWTDHNYLFGVLDGIHASQGVTVVIEGAAPGADDLAAKWANGHRIKVLPFPADWDAHRPADPSKKNPAGAIRNRRMLTSGRPELVVAFWDGRSPGTADMIAAAREAQVEVWIFRGPQTTARSAAIGG